MLQIKCYMQTYYINKYSLHYSCHVTKVKNWIMHLINLPRMCLVIKSSWQNNIK